jgi:hypothetical protein
MVEKHARKMQINMVTEPGAIRRWHVDLAERLRRDGHAVYFSTEGGAPASLPLLDLLETFERLVYRIPAADFRLRERVPHTDDQGAAHTADLTIDLSTRPSLGGAGVRKLVPIFDGGCGEAAAVALLLEGRSPSLGAWVGDGDHMSLVAAGSAALEEPHCLTRSLAQINRRCGDVLHSAVRRLGANEALDDTLDRPGLARVSPLAPARFAAAGLAAKISHRLTALAQRPNHWRIGWRRTANDSLADTLVWPASDFAFLHDDAARYYADPFVFVEDGVAHVFCEEFPYATGKAIISVFTIERDGTIGHPRPVLETRSHLSYPMVFRHDGAIWMIPETSAESRIELYRAEHFPDRWTHAATLVDGVTASDATLVGFGGRLWIFATIAEAGASTWDALGLFHATAIEGPWSAHPANPVLVDASAARPAGQMFHRSGRLLRPAQDCRAGYGAALSFCAVERLDTEGFSQRVIERFAPPAAWHAKGMHTYNAAGGFEVVDCVGARRRL